MKTHDWVARIEWATHDDVDTNDVDMSQMANAILEAVAGDSATYGPRSCAVTLTLTGAHDYHTAGDALAQRLSDALGTVHHWAVDALDIVDVEVQRADHQDAQLATPVIPPLVGVSEAAEILGVTRQRAHTMAATSTGFPTPVAELASGPVFLELAVRAFAAIPRRPGRPAKTA